MRLLPRPAPPPTSSPPAAFFGQSHRSAPPPAAAVLGSASAHCVALPPPRYGQSLRATVPYWNPSLPSSRYTAFQLPLRLLSPNTHFLPPTPPLRRAIAPRDSSRLLGAKNSLIPAACRRPRLKDRTIRAAVQTCCISTRPLEAGACERYCAERRSISLAPTLQWHSRTTR